MPERCYGDDRSPFSVGQAVTFPLILQQYLAPLLTLQTSSDAAPALFGISLAKPFLRSANIEYANPVGLDEQGLPFPSAISLSAAGDRSIRQIFLRPYFQFMATAENYRFTLRIPASLFFPIRQLLQPQTATPSHRPAGSSLAPNATSPPSSPTNSPPPTTSSSPSTAPAPTSTHRVPFLPSSKVEYSTFPNHFFYFQFYCFF